MLKVLEEIEKNREIETITFKGQAVWPFLRIYFSSKLLSDIGSKSVDSSVIKSFFNSMFYGFLNLFKKHSYLYFSSSDQRKLIEGFYTDKSIDSINTILGQGLVYELPVPKHFPQHKIPTKHIRSKFGLYILVLIYAKLFVRKEKIENEQLLRDILQENDVDINYNELIYRMYAQYKVMTLIAKIYKPKAAFFVCYYTQMGFIKALKEQNVKVVEIQHGLINKTHDAYNVFKYIDSSFYPDYLLTFGEGEKKVFNENNFCIEPEKVIPVGHFYLDYLSLCYSVDNRFQDIQKAFRFTIAITSQNHPIEKKLITFVIEAANLDPTILFVFIPRTPGKSAADYGFPKNVIVVDWLNCYEIMVQSDFHSTVFSTCALEAPSLGVQNIMLNLEGLSTIHFGTILSNPTVTQFISTPEQFVNKIHSFEKVDKEEIKNLNKEIILPNYQQNLRLVLEQILPQK